MALGRKTGGRTAGTPNTATVEREKAMNALLLQLGLSEANIDAHTFLQRLYRAADVPLAIRLEAAKAAIRHEKPTLAAVEPVPAGTFVKHEDAVEALWADPDDAPPRIGAASPSGE